jgi:RNA polymerase sigma factor (sigma-70 family)
MAESPVNLEELVASERGRVLRLCSSRISDPVAAEDVTQEIFAKFAEKIANDTESIREPKAWLTRVAENACADYGRRLVKRRKGRRPNQKQTIESAGEKPARDAILLFENELPESGEINSNDETNLDAFTRAIDQAAMDQAHNGAYYEHDEYDELSLDQIHLLGRLKRPERLAFLACGPWNLDESAASMFLDSKLAKKVARERLKWGREVPIVAASRAFKIKEGTLSSQLSRATAKLKNRLQLLESNRPVGIARSEDNQPRLKVEESVAESVVKQRRATKLNLASQAFARVVREEPTSLVPGWAGTPPLTKCRFTP